MSNVEEFTDRSDLQNELLDAAAHADEIREVLDCALDRGLDDRLIFLAVRSLEQLNERLGELQGNA